MSAVSISVCEIDIVEFEVSGPCSQSSSQVISGDLVQRQFLSDGNDVLIVVVCVCRVAIDGEGSFARCDVNLFGVRAGFDEDGLGCCGGG